MFLARVRKLGSPCTTKIYRYLDFFDLNRYIFSVAGLSIFLTRENMESLLSLGHMTLKNCLNKEQDVVLIGIV